LTVKWHEIKLNWHYRLTLANVNKLKLYHDDDNMTLKKSKKHASSCFPSFEETADWGKVILSE